MWNSSYFLTGTLLCEQCVAEGKMKPIKYYISKVRVMGTRTGEDGDAWKLQKPACGVRRKLNSCGIMFCWITVSLHLAKALLLIINHKAWWL